MILLLAKCLHLHEVVQCTHREMHYIVTYIRTDSSFTLSDSKLRILDHSLRAVSLY